MSKQPEPVVSDHALLRYLERVYEFDLAKFRAEMLTPEVRAALRVGATAVNVGNFRFVLRENTVVTVTQRNVNMKAEDLKRFTPRKARS